MKFKKIINSASKDFKKIWKIYESSFPSDERRTLKQIKAIKNKSHTLTAIYDKNTLLGFIETWEFNNFIFNEHFAVEKSLRYKGLGTKIMKEFLSKNNKNIVLEVQKHNVSKNAKRRINFYEKLNFKLNNYDYIQPPYDKDKKPVPLFLMTYPKKISKPEFIKIRNKLHTTVYGLKNTLI